MTNPGFGGWFEGVGQDTGIDGSEGSASERLQQMKEDAERALNITRAAGSAIINAEGKSQAELLSQQQAFQAQREALAEEEADSLPRISSRGSAASLTQLKDDARDRVSVIRTAMLNGTTTEAEGQQQLLLQQRSFQEKRMAAAQKNAADLRKELESEQDPGKQQEINDDIVKADTEAASARIAISRTYAEESKLGREQDIESAKEALKRREEIEKAALERIEAANRESDARITESQQQRILAVKTDQLNGVKTAEEASAAIAQIEQEGISQTIAARRVELAEVLKLRQQGIISAEEGRDRELSINSEIGKLNIERIDSQIQAQERARVAALKAIEDEKKAIIAAIEAVGKADVAPLQATQIKIGIVGDSNNLQAKLLSAQLELQQSIAQVEQTRFDSAIQRAKIAGDESKVEQLKLQQIQAQQAAQEQQFEIQKQQLALSQRQRALDLQREQTTAKIAEIEAQVAVDKAIANDASAQEIANLQRILGLRQKQVSLAQNTEQQQAKLNELENGELAANQTNARERDKIALIEQQQQNSNPRGNATAAGGGTGSSEGRILTSRGVQTLSAEDSEKQRIEQGRRYGFNASGTIAQLNSKVPAPQIGNGTGTADLGQTIQTGDAAVVAKLDELKVAVLLLANAPRSVTVSAPDPVAAVGKVLSDIGRASLKRARL